MKKNSKYGTDDLDIYLRDIRNMPVLSREEEEKYGRLAAKGNIYAKEKLANSNLRFVVKIAKGYQNLGMSLGDLIQEGNTGLMEAIERFDVDKGRFTTYSVWWIKDYILKALDEKLRTIRLPAHRSRKLAYIKEMQGELNLEEIAKRVKMLETDVRHLLRVSQAHIPLSTPIVNDDKPETLESNIKSEDYETQQETVEYNEFKAEINEVLDTLTEIEAGILRYRFGLNGIAPLTLKEVGEIYKLSKERIRLIQKRALKKLGDFDNIEAWILDDYVD
tara:strand:- start:13097 stop:13924 length:828 start_codon:yes stop_codon:yes gene_type:complete